VIKIPPEKKISQNYKPSETSLMKKRRPYWNFYRVVLAGWAIRYPGKFFKIIGVPLGILIVMVYNALR
jgi:hypothetical protein